MNGRVNNTDTQCSKIVSGSSAICAHIRTSQINGISARKYNDSTPTNTLESCYHLESCSILDYRVVYISSTRSDRSILRTTYRPFYTPSLSLQNKLVRWYWYIIHAWITCDTRGNQRNSWYNHIPKPCIIDNQTISMNMSSPDCSTQPPAAQL